MVGSVCSRSTQKVGVTSMWAAWGVEAESWRTRLRPEQERPFVFESGSLLGPVCCCVRPAAVEVGEARLRRGLGRDVRLPLVCAHAACPREAPALAPVSGGR